ncbi:BON domain-containing protein [Hyphobacterium indicum]|uniref:BON domain-containing protein n=1 Tax=Hyphobacterium indicum TaxID=2162714 RepID=UPI000D647BBA|nr:BON domain-containing protein [Hyphobacterium indicum]
MIFRFIPAFLALWLSACAAMQPERSIGRDIDDTNASLSIKAAMTRAEGYALDGVDVEVTDGLALLTGTAPREEDRRQAECLAWSALAVRAVENEIEVGSASTLRDGARDSWITQQVRSRLLRDRSVRSVNYNVEAENGRVFLLGIARTRGELERAAQHASLVDGVTDVVTLVRVIGEETTPVARGERQAIACGGEAIPALDSLPSLDPPQDVRSAPVTPID